MFERPEKLQIIMRHTPRPWDCLLCCISSFPRNQFLDKIPGLQMRAPSTCRFAPTGSMHVKRYTSGGADGLYMCMTRPSIFALRSSFAFLPFPAAALALILQAISPKAVRSRPRPPLSRSPPKTRSAHATHVSCRTISFCNRLSAYVESHWFGFHRIV